MKNVDNQYIPKSFTATMLYDEKAEKAIETSKTVGSQFSEAQKEEILSVVTKALQYDFGLL